MDGTIMRQTDNLLSENEQEFEQLLSAHDIDQAKSWMSTRTKECLEVIGEYDVMLHKINDREDKIISNGEGNRVGEVKLWKIAIPYQIYINEIALVFLLGEPLAWSQRSQGTDDAFAKFQDVLAKTHFNAKIRQCKRLAGAETESAMLFRVYRDSDGEAALQLRVLAATKGDEIYTRFDQYENLVTFAWGYHVKEAGNKTVYHLDIFTKEKVYNCAQRENGWEVEEMENYVGKIPVIYFRQEKEWYGADKLIEREESIGSETADTNEYFSNPLLILSADYIKNLPKKDAVGKTLVVRNRDGGTSGVAEYLTWDNAPQSKIEETKWLQDHILSKTFTPDIKLDTLKSLGNVSGKALRTVLMLGFIKANKNKDIYDEMIARVGTLLTSIIGNVLDVSLKTQCDNLRLSHEWTDPFGEDIEKTLQELINAVDAGIISKKTAIQKNPLVDDAVAETQRIEEEEEASSQRQNALFGNGAGSYKAPQNNTGEENGEGGEDNNE